MHVRTQIRNALAAALANLPTTGPRVFVSRVSPLAAHELPAIVISVRDEPARERAIPGQHPPYRMRCTAQVEISAHVMAMDGVENVIDTIDGEIMAALHASRDAATLGGLVPHGIQPRSYDGSINDDGEQPVMTGRFLWEAAYYLETNAPDAAI